MSSDPRRGGSVIDADFWAQRGSLVTIASYLDDTWRRYLKPGVATVGLPPFELPEGGVQALGLATRRPGGPNSDGSAAARSTDQSAVEAARARLDVNGIELAVLNPGTAAGLSGLVNVFLTNEVARATNNWLMSEWLDADSRFRGSILVSPRDSGLAAAEIRRVAADQRMVQVLLCYPPWLLGDKRLHAIYEAADEFDLAIALQAGGSWSGANKGLTAFGTPLSPYEDQVGWEAGAQAHLTSIICSGMFDTYPNLRFVMSGYGVAWLPSLLWRLDMEYKKGRLPMPATLTRLPSEYVSERVSFTTQPLEIPDHEDQLVKLLEMVGAQQLLLYGSGMPIWADDTAATLAAFLPDEWQRAIFHDNAARVYRSTLSRAASS